MGVMPSTTLIENAKFRLEIESSTDSLYARLVGLMDEDTNLAQLLDFVTQAQPVLKHVQFDLGGVSRINSCGVRDWVLMIERLERLVSFDFVCLSSCFVEQANMIGGLLGKPRRRIGSFQMPFRCEACDVDVTLTVQTQDVVEQSGEYTVPEQKCQKCAAPLELDTLIELYSDLLKAPR